MTAWPPTASNTIIKFADDTTIIGLITGDNETACREVRVSQTAALLPLQAEEAQHGLKDPLQLLQKVCQELRGESSTFQLPEEEESLLSLLYQVSCVHGPGQVRCDVDAQELDIVDTLNCFPVDEERSVLCPPGPPVVHYDLLGLCWCSEQGCCLSTTE
ncbi:hypothetical protein L3Q82_020871 [Scortum barcoo]|uniref:Uncharacterized protein n=1 Tax=Scortum barcoo TaxID=214431 RepID=A0ACB8V9C5_9TELE|nr:hypothetical protein L3Q82_020871 [Scortum barcoo]